LISASDDDTRTARARRDPPRETVGIDSRRGIT
jgi:hypothetical protein